MTTPVRRVIAITGAVDYAELVNVDYQLQGDNITTATVVRGDEVLFRFTLTQTLGSSTAFAIPSRAGLELVISDAFQNKVESTIQCYADDTQSNPADWTDYDRAGGKVSFRIDLNSTNLATDLGTEDEKSYYCALVMTPPPDA